MQDALRLLRLCRILRFIRILHFVNELRSLVISIVDSLTSLIWLLLLMFMMTYIMGVVLTHVVTDHKLSQGREEIEKHQEILEEYYGSLDRSMMKLYQAISEGVHWGEVSEPLVVFLSPWFDLVFALYMAFVLFAVMNVVTAVVVEKALRDAEEEKQKYMSQDTWEMFRDVMQPPDVAGGVDHAAGADCDEALDITPEVFYNSLGDQQMQDYINMLSLNEKQAREINLFELIDGDGSGKIDLQELVDSCMRLAGSAKAVDVAVLSREIRLERKLMEKHRKTVEAALLKASVTLCKSVPKKGNRAP